MDLNEMLHKDPVEVNPQAGQLLIAEPMMADGIFSRSVILLLDKNTDNEYMGLCLNKGPVCSLSDIYNEMEEASVIPVYQGGPVGLDRLFMLHSMPEVFADSVEIAHGIFLGYAREDNVKKLLQNRESAGDARFFIGYSGWGVDQLTSEIMQNSWALNINPDTNELLLGEGDKYWEREVERLGHDYRSWLLFPSNPSMN